MRDARLRVWLQPRASRTEIAGWHGDLIKIRVAAPPVNGAANEELIRFLAEYLRLPKSSVTVVAGHSTRRKTIAIHGLSAEEIASRLTA